MPFTIFCDKVLLCVCQMVVTVFSQLDSIKLSLAFHWRNTVSNAKFPLWDTCSAETQWCFCCMGSLGKNDMEDVELANISHPNNAALFSGIFSEWIDTPVSVRVMFRLRKHIMASNWSGRDQVITWRSIYLK